MKNRTKTLEKKRRDWMNEKRSYEKIFLGITGKKIRVLDIEPQLEGQVGYTDMKSIHLAHSHPLYDGLTEEEARVIRKGVFAHEMLHCIFTNNDLRISKLYERPAVERKILAEIANILEDPAIENFAPQIIDGSLLRALRLSIAHIYNISPNINESKNPFSQFMNAMIQFGDMGMIKGRFTFPEAYEIFKKVAPILNKGIEEPSAAKRLEYSEEILELSRPLWQDEADLVELLTELFKELEERGKHSSSDSSPSGLQKEPEESTGSSEKKKRRNITIRKVSKEEMEELMENGEVNEGELPEEGDIELLVCDEMDEEEKGKNGAGVPIPMDKNSDEKSESGDSEGEDKGDNDSSNGEEGENLSAGGESSSDSEDSSNENGDSGSTSDSGKDESEDKGEPKGESSNFEDDSDYGFDSSFGGESAEMSKDTSEESTKPSSSSDRDHTGGAGESIDSDYPVINEEEYIITPEDIAAIEEEIERAGQEIAKEEMKEANSDGTPIEDIAIDSHYFKNASCLNQKVVLDDKSSLQHLYSKNLEPLQNGIRTLAKDLKRMFRSDRGNKTHHTSGRINLYRYSSGRVSTRIFDKRRAPGEIDDLAVFILVDESGSMWGDKEIAARQSCIALAETFDILDIPLYIMGFTADDNGYDANHMHYVNWSNTVANRLKLLNITARRNNFDGYSIRYAGEILKKKNAKHKLLVVLSDGQPACFKYSDVSAIPDTKDAIKGVKEFASVLGVAIGNNDTEQIRSLYEKDFLHISNVNELFIGVAKQIQKIIKSWK